MTTPLRACLGRLAACASLLFCAGLAWPGTTTDFTFTKKDYDGSRERRYKVYVPDGLSGPAPMVMALHGCRQTHDDVLRDWGLVQAADRYRFVLVAPFVTSWDRENEPRNDNCWGFWFYQHRHEGAGEVEDLHRIALEVEGRQAIDPQRRYITGLSSGGAMTVAAAVAHNEYWAAAAAAAGLPYGEEACAVTGACPFTGVRFLPLQRIVERTQAELGSPYPVPLLVAQNLADATVTQPAGRNLRDEWLKAFGGAGHDTAAKARARDLACSPVFKAAYRCRQVRYTADGRPGSRSVVETVFFQGPLKTSSDADTDHGHYWVGGEHGGEGLWAVRQGPSFPDIFWDFFARHPRGGPGSGTPPALPACEKAVASPWAHLQAGRAVVGGLVVNALATGDAQYIGATWDLASPVVLYRGAGELWFRKPPGSCSG